MLAFALSIALTLQSVPQRHLIEPPKPEQVLATVNGKPITANEVAPLLWQWRGEEAIQDLISYQMIVSEAHKQGASVTDAEVEKALDAHLEQLRKDPNIGDLDTWMKQNGFTRSRLFLRKKSELLMDKMVARGFRPENFVKVSTIVVKPANEQASAVANAIKQAQDAYDRLSKGEEWGTVLAAYVKDPAVIRSKGLLGWRDLDAFPQSVQQELRKLEAGQITQPAQTQFGIQLFKIETKGANAQGQDLEELKSAYTQNARATLLAQIKESTKIERLWP